MYMRETEGPFAFLGDSLRAACSYLELPRLSWGLLKDAEGSCPRRHCGKLQLHVLLSYSRQTPADSSSI